jgi:hypothetical protein
MHEAGGRRVVVPIAPVAKEFPCISKTTVDLTREWVAMNRDCLSCSRPTCNTARNNGDLRMQSLLPTLARLKKIRQFPNQQSRIRQTRSFPTVDTSSNGLAGIPPHIHITCQFSP